LWLDIPFEIGILVGVYLIYGFCKSGLGLAEKSALAYKHALDIVHLEKTLGIFVEPHVQSFFLETSFRIDLANSMYTFGYYPPLFLFAIWAYWRHRDKYRTMRTVFLISSTLAFICFALYPTAPPRFFDGSNPGAENLGFVDSLVVYWGVGGPSSQRFYNPYAAMPSCHLAWALMIGVGLWWMTKSRWGRAIGVMLPTIMLVGIVATANHFILDAVGGAALLGISIGLAALFYRLKDRLAERKQTVSECCEEIPPAI